MKSWSVVIWALAERRAPDFFAPDDRDRDEADARADEEPARARAVEEREARLRSGRVLDDVPPRLLLVDRP
jgi:hypothetical protein